jgi:hypothetical protein
MWHIADAPLDHDYQNKSKSNTVITYFKISHSAFEQNDFID